MQMVSSIISRTITSLSKTRSPILLKCPFFAATTQKLQQPEIPRDFRKWGSVGFCRMSKFANGFTPLQTKPLDSIVDVEILKDRYLDDIASIWDDATDILSFLCGEKAVIRQCLFKCQTPHILFTGLEDYKARRTQAAPYFTVTFYKEFTETRDLVLIRGDVVFTSKLTDSEAEWLIETVQSFYLNDARYKLVERFNKETHDFEFKDVLQALNMSIL